MKYNLIILSVLISFLSFSQDEVKKNIYKGNVFYHDSEFKDAVYYYEKAVAESGFNYKANYNLANAYFRLEEFDKAIETYEKIAEYTNTNIKKAKIYHNIGNAQMYALNNKGEGESKTTTDQLERVDNAIEAYKTALRANPNDEETRYNLAYALLIKKQLEEQKKQEQKDNKDQKDDKDKKDSDDKKEGDKNESDQNKEGDKKEGDDSKDKKDSDKKDGEPDDKKDGDKSDDEKEGDDNKDKNDGESQQKPQQQKISKAQAKRILDAAQKSEKEIQDKLNKQKVIVGKKGKAKPKKDW